MRVCVCRGGYCIQCNYSYGSSQGWMDGWIWADGMEGGRKETRYYAIGSAATVAGKHNSEERKTAAMQQATNRMQQPTLKTRNALSQMQSTRQRQRK